MDAEDPYYLHFGEPEGPAIADILRTPCVGGSYDSGEDLGFLAPRKENANRFEYVEKRSVCRSLRYEGATPSTELEADVTRLQDVMREQVKCNFTISQALSDVGREIFCVKRCQVEVKHEMENAMSSMMATVNAKVESIEKKIDLLAQMVSTQAQTNSAVMQHLSDMKNVIGDS